MNVTESYTNDALDYLPARPIARYRRGQIIYSGNCQSLYAVTEGWAEVVRMDSGDRGAIVRVVPKGRLFGEPSLIERPWGEQATALGKVGLMAWSPKEIEQLIEEKPMFGVALLENLMVTELELQDRLQVTATSKTCERVMFSLLQVARSAGVKTEGRAMRMPPMTHYAIALHVGTSREIVTSHMVRLRQLGLVSYSRSHIDVDCEAMQEALRNRGVHMNELERVQSTGR